MVETSDIIWIEDAANEYGRSRVWLKEQLDSHVLSTVTIPGDRKIYLLRSELDNLLRPRVVKPAKDNQVG